MKRLISYHLQLFIKTKIILISSVLLFLIVNGYNILLLRSQSALDVLLFSNNTGIVALIGFLFLSYEYVQKAKQVSLDETLSCIPNAKIKIFLAQLIPLITAVVLIWLNVAAYNVAVYFREDIATLPYLKHIFLSTFLNVAAVGFVACLIGIFFSLKLKRIPAYLLMIIISFLMSPFFEHISFTLNEFYHVNLYGFWYAIRLLAPDGNWQPDHLYGMPIETYRWWLAFMWSAIFLLVNVLINSSLRKKTVKLTAAVLIMIITVSSVLSFLPSSIVRKDLGPYAGDLIDYRYEVDEGHAATDSQAQKAEFSVLSYDIKLTVNRQMSADAVLLIDTENKPDSYTFTLYRGYAIHTIIDQSGNNLAFTQEGNYFTIHDQLSYPTAEIHITYSGSSGKYYSNRQGISLPGYFPYYPMAGHLKLWESESYNVYVNTDFEAKQFYITVNSDLNIVSNLEQTEPKHFSGHTQSVSLFGGFVEDETVGDICATNFTVDPIDTSQLNTLQSTWLEMKALIGEEGAFPLDEPSNVKLMLMPETITSGTGSNNEECVVFDDHMLTAWIDPEGLSAEYIHSLIPYSKEKSALEDSFIWCLHIIDSYVANYNTGKMPTIDEMYFEEGSDVISSIVLGEALAYQMDRLGTEYVMKQVYAYLLDEDSTVNCAEFIYNLQ